jgi:hypothetical protein
VIHVEHVKGRDILQSFEDRLNEIESAGWEIIGADVGVEKGWWAVIIYDDLMRFPTSAVSPDIHVSSTP